MNLLTKPYYWISAHREAKYVFEYEKRYGILTWSNYAASGKLAIFFLSDGINAQEVGDYVYVEGGIYKGYHKISAIPNPNIYVTETDYISQDLTNTYYLRFIEDHVFEIYAGFDPLGNAELYAFNPEHLVATFKPEPNADGQLEVDISGYTNKLFDVINSNDTTTIDGTAYYLNLFTVVNLRIDGAKIAYHSVINAAISMLELNRDYVGTNRALNGGSLGTHYLTCGISDLIYLNQFAVIRGQRYVDGIRQICFADFTLGDFDTGDFSTTSPC